ncbi:MAG: hypothetical protein NVSMB3_13630 [Acidobacteriaceae bacterium]
MMGVSIERLRVWLLAMAGLLVVVIASFLGYAHFRAHRFLKDLPGRLGVNITRESNGFTYSQSGKGGRTIYTIHAAKLVQYKDGKTTLRDVGIVLYGPRQDRADRIYGSEFEYDQKAGVVRAMGEVHLDLQAPAPADARGRSEYAAGREPGAGQTGAASAGSGEHAGADDRMVHVKTSGLVFLQSLGVASTDREIEFQYHGLNGRAKGADYNSDTGVTVLQSEVRVSGLRDGQPVMLTAARAEMDRGKEEVRLERAHYLAVGVGERGDGRNQNVSAERAVVHLRGDGSVERIVGSGGVSLEQAGGVLRGGNAEVTVSAQSRPETAHLFGGLTYSEAGRLREIHGHAGQGRARFDASGRIASTVLTESAEMSLRERASDGAAWNDRAVSGDRIDLGFADGGGASGGLPAGARGEGGREWLREVVASGGGRMVLVDRGARDGGREEATSELRGDTLSAQLVWDGRSSRLSQVNGAGHTLLRRSDGEGGLDTSEGGSLTASFGPGPGVAAKPKAKVQGASMGAKEGITATAVLSAVQSGGVMLTHLPGRGVAGRLSSGANAANVGLVRATAGQASFAGDGQTLTLAGQAQVTEGDSLLRADVVTMRRDTGDATAEGSVKASYRQAGSAEPVHVLAARADLKHDAGRAVFFGGKGTSARIWQGASQVEAMVLEFSQREKTLVARTSGPSDQVHTVLVGSRGGGGGARERQQVMRVASHSLRYADAERRAEFGGGVVLEDADGTVRGSQVVALMKAARGAVGGEIVPGTAEAGLLGGSVERVSAEGEVEVRERGRRASGEKLVYTAGDGMFVMTGTPASPPKVVDDLQGTVTGAALQFHAGDNSVMVLGTEKGGEGRRVRTETQVRQR